MGVTLDELKVMIDAEIAPFKNKMKEVENRVKGTSSKVQESTNKIKEQSGSMLGVFGKLAKFAGFAYLGKKLLDVGMYSTQMALEVTASINQIKRQMGESSQTFLKWVNANANAMNMGVGEATNYGAVYSNLFSGFIKDTNKLSAYTAKMLQTSAVIAEGSGRSITDVMERIRSGLLGNTEAIEDLGINVNVAMIQSTEAFKRFANGQSWNQLDYQTQQQIRLMAILEQATAKYGTTLSQSVNGRISLFKSLLKDSALNIGNAFLPIINAIMPVLNSFAMVLKNVTGKLAEFIALMFNKKATVKDGGIASAASSAGDALQDAAGGAGDLADAMDDADDASGGIADNLDDTAKSAKKAVKELLGLMGFDEINLLNKKDDSDDDDGAGKGKGGGGGGKGKKGKGGGGGGPFKDILPEVALTDMDNQFKSIFDGLGDKLKGLFDLFGKGFNAAFRSEGLERIKIALGEIGKTLAEIATDPRVVDAFDRMTKKVAYALGQIAGSIATVGVGIGVFLAESIANGLGRQKQHIIRAIVASFDSIGEIYEAVGNIAQALSSAFYDAITSTGAVRIGSSLVSIFLGLGSIVTEISMKLGSDIMQALERAIVDNAPGLSNSLQNLFQSVAPIFESAEQALNKIIDTISVFYENNISPLIKTAGEDLSKLIDLIIKGWDENIQPVFDEFGKGISEVINGNLGETVEKIVEFNTKFLELAQTFNRYFYPVIMFIVEVFFKLLGPVFNFLAQIFINTYDFITKLVGDIAELLTGIVDIIQGIFSGDFSKVQEGLSEIVSALFSFLENASQFVYGLTFTTLSALWDLVKVLFQIIFDTIVDIFSPFAERFTGVFQAAWDGIVAIFTGLGTWFGERWNEVTTALSNIDTWFTDIFQNGWDGLTNIFTGLGTWFSERWSDVTNALSNIGAWFTDMFQNAWTGLTNVFSGLGTWFTGRWSDVTNALANVATWFGDIFTRAYNAVTNAFSSIGSFFSGVWSTVQSIFVNAGQAVGSAVGGAFRSAVNAVLGTIENVVNGFIGMINGVIGLINKLPGVSLGSIGYVNLPRLARGGIVDSPTVAMIGEAGKEVVMPLENTGFLQTMGRIVGGAVVNALGGGLPQSGGFSGNGDIVIQIGGHEFGRVAIQEINREQERAGQVLLNI
nr:MAG TPA: minor tail protein [Bacteriophage sp.]